MISVVATHQVDDVDHWLASPKRDEFFAVHGMSVRAFVDPAGVDRVGVLIEDVPSLEALQKALGGPDAEAAMKHDGVRPDTLELYVSS